MCYLILVFLVSEFLSGVLHDALLLLYFLSQLFYDVILLLDTVPDVAQIRQLLKIISNKVIRASEPG